MPCLNEARTLPICIKKAREFLSESHIEGEVLVSDNGSTDGSQQIAESCGARVVHVAERGYGSALIGGIRASRGRYIIMGDADDSYDFSALGPMLRKLRGGHELVMGNRFKGSVMPGAMPFHHKYLGNPVLTFIGRLFFRSPVRDFHCGLRGFNRESIIGLDLRTTGMEFASEMVVKASLHKLNLCEVPITLSRDGRGRPPHLRSWRDGWRHLKFLLMYSPRWLFFYPGLAMIAAGLFLLVWLLPAPRVVLGATLDIHSILYAAISIILGFQAVSFALLTNCFAVSTGLLPDDDHLIAFLRKLMLHRGIAAGAVFSLLGLAGLAYMFVFWSRLSFGRLSPPHTMRIAIPSLILLTLGIQMVFASFFMFLLNFRFQK
jgi:glycosyltransferase involved in cell wall biosynthesis